MTPLAENVKELKETKKQEKTKQEEKPKRLSYSY
jgi:hypothetical protein